MRQQDVSTLWEHAGRTGFGQVFETAIEVAVVKESRLVVAVSASHIYETRARERAIARGKELLDVDDVVVLDETMSSPRPAQNGRYLVHMLLTLQEQ